MRRNPDIAAMKNKLVIKHLHDEIGLHNDKMTLAKEEIATLDKDIIGVKSEISISELELENLPLKHSEFVHGKNSECNHQITKIERVTDIYKSHILNDNLPISIDSLKDRINVYLEGWNDLLHHEYAVPKAIEKSELAAAVATEWQNAKLDMNKLDKRIKIN